MAKEENPMSPKSLEALARKPISADKKTAALRAGGSVKTKHKIDADEICRQVRGKE